MNVELWVIYATALVGVLGVILGLVPRVATTWTDWLETKRRIAISKDDADILDLRRQVKHLVDRLEDRDARDRAHTEWDRELYQWALRNGWDGPPPPALF